jgi:hypothetical protein
VSFGNIVRKNRGVEFGFLPVAVLHILGQLLTVDADLPGQYAVCLKFRFAEFVQGRFVIARKGIEGEAPVLVEIKMIVALFGRSFRDGIERIDDVLEENPAVGFKKAAKVLRQSVDGLVYDQLVGIAAPRGGETGRKKKRREQGRESRQVCLACSDTVCVCPHRHC